jgi:hypothetical protein
VDLLQYLDVEETFGEHPCFFATSATGAFVGFADDPNIFSSVNLLLRIVLSLRARGEPTF